MKIERGKIREFSFKLFKRKQEAVCRDNSSCHSHQNTHITYHNKELVMRSDAVHLINRRVYETSQRYTDIAL